MTSMSETNVEQRKAWNGADGDFWVERADRLDAGVANYMEPFLDAAAIQPTDSVLDIGCGSGATTRAAAARAKQVLGVDLSGQLVELGRQRSAGIGNIRFEQADAQVHPFAEGEFDVVISRNGSMFFDDPVAAFGNIRRALKPGGRVVLLAWQPMDDNGWISTFRTILAAGRDLPKPPPEGVHPFSLGDPDRVRLLLGKAGFHDIRLTGLRKAMWFGRDTEDAVDYISNHFGGLIDAEQRDSVLAALRADVAQHQTDRGIEYDSASWLIQATG